MALWDLKFTPSLGALRAYAQRHGLGSLGASDDEKAKLLAQKATAERRADAAKESAAKAAEKALEADYDAIYAAERAEPDRVLVDMLVGNDPVWKKAVNDIQIKLDADAKAQFATFPAVKKREAQAGKARKRAARKQQTAEKKAATATVLARRAEVADESLVGLVRKLWERMYLKGFGSKEFFRAVQWVNSSGGPGSEMATEAAYHMMRTLTRGYEVLDVLGAEVARELKEGEKELSGDDVRNYFFSKMADAYVFFPSKQMHQVTVTTLGMLVPAKLDRLVDLISAPVTFGSFPAESQEMLAAFVEKHEDARVLETNLLLRRMFPLPLNTAKPGHAYFNELRAWFASVAWSMITTLIVGSEGARKKMQGKTYAEQFVEDTAIIDLRMALVGDITAQAGSTHSIWSRSAELAKAQELPYLASDAARGQFKSKGLSLKVFTKKKEKTLNFSIEGLEVQYGSFLKVMERASSGTLEHFVKMLPTLQRELLNQIEFTSRGLARKERAGAGGAVREKEAERAFITESIRVTAPRSADEETYADLQRVRDERFLELMDTYFPAADSGRPMSRALLNEHVEQLKALAVADPDRRNQTMGRMLRVTAALQNVQAHMANVATNAQARATRASTADLFSERMNLAQRFTGAVKDEDIATQLWRMFASREVSAIYSARTGQNPAERWYDFSKRESVSTDKIRRSWMTQEMQRLGMPLLLAKGGNLDLASQALRFGSTRQLTQELDLCGKSNREFSISAEMGQRAKESPTFLESFDLENGFHRFLYSYYLARAIEQNVPANAGVARTAMATELWFRIPKLLLAAGQVTGPLRFEKALNLVEEDQKAGPEKRLGLELPEQRKYTKAEEAELTEMQASSAEAGAEFKRILDHKIFMARVTSLNQTMSDRRRLVDRVVLQVNMALALRESTGLIPPELLVPALGPRGMNLTTAVTAGAGWTLEKLLRVEDDYVLMLRGLRTFRDTAAQIVAQIPEGAPGAVMLKEYTLKALTESMEQLQGYGKQLNARISAVARETERVEEVKAFRESREERFKSEQTQKLLFAKGE